MATGTDIVRMAAAERRSKGRTYAPTRRGTHWVERYQLEFWMRIWAKKKSFHTHMNWKTMTAAMAGRVIGRTIL